MTPTPTDTLDTASVEELNEAFAAEVSLLIASAAQCANPVADARASLPHLAKCEWNAWTQGEGAAKRVFVGIYPGKGERGYAPSYAATFERAVVLALIRHARARKMGNGK